MVPCFPQTGHAYVSHLLHSAEAEETSKRLPVKASITPVKIPMEVMVSSLADESFYLLEGARREGAVYEDSKAYVYLELELDRPLVDKRPASVLANRSVCARL